MTVYIKHMVCSRCKMVVQAELERIGLLPLQVELGEVQLAQPPGKEKLEEMKAHLQRFGFEVIDNRKSRIIAQVKQVIVGMVHHADNDGGQNLSELLSARLHYDYGYLSSLFSEVEGITIEKYLIAQKIERVKELLVYDELSLSEIAFQLNYSSVAYLSTQFKKVTGLTPSFYRSMKERKRKSIADL